MEKLIELEAHGFTAKQEGDKTIITVQLSDIYDFLRQFSVDDLIKAANSLHAKPKLQHLGGSIFFEAKDTDFEYSRPIISSCR